MKSVTLYRVAEGDCEWTCPHCKSDEDSPVVAIDSEVVCQNCFHSYYVGKVVNN